MTSPVADLAGVLSRRDIRLIARAARLFGERFPQIHIHTVTCHIRSPYPVSLYAIWALNRGGLCRGADAAGNSRDILLALNPDTRTAALTLGYGLEPFVGVHHLENAVAAGRKELASGHFAKAIRPIFDALAEALCDISKGLNRTFGIDTDAIYESEIGRGVALPIRHVTGHY